MFGRSADRDSGGAGAWLPSPRLAAWYMASISLLLSPLRFERGMVAEAGARCVELDGVSLDFSTT